VKYYMGFVENLLFFFTVQKLSKNRFTFAKVITSYVMSRFFMDHSVSNGEMSTVIIYAQLLIRCDLPMACL